MLRLAVATFLVSFLIAVAPAHALDLTAEPVSLAIQNNDLAWGSGGKPEGNIPNVFETAKELFRINRETGMIEIIDHPELYSGEAAKKTVYVAAVFGTTAGGKSATCRFISCAMGRPTAFPSSHDSGDGREPTRGLWSTPFVELADGTRFLLIDMEGFDNSEQDVHVRSAVLKLLALLSEIASVFIQVRKTSTHQTSDMEAIAKIVDSVRTALLLKPPTKGGVDSPVGPDENFPALLIAHIREGNIDADRAAEIRNDLTKQGHEKNYEDMKSINRNYIEIVPADPANGLPEGVHYDYLPIKMLPKGERLQNKIESMSDPKQLWDDVRNLEDKNEEQGSTDRHIGQAYITDILNVRDRILHLGRLRLDGRKRKITGEKMKQLLTVGVAEMNKRGPINSVKMWNQIAIDNCLTLIQQEVQRLVDEEILPMNMTLQIGDALRSARRRLDEFVAKLTANSEVDVNARCKAVREQTWDNYTKPFQLQAAGAVIKGFYEDMLSKKDKQIESLSGEKKELKRREWMKEWEAKLPWLSIIFAACAIMMMYLSKLCPCCAPKPATMIVSAPAAMPADVPNFTEMTQKMEMVMYQHQQRMDEAMRQTQTRIEQLASFPTPGTPGIAIATSYQIEAPRAAPELNASRSLA